MKTYEYGRIAKLAESLEAAGISREIADRIMEGGESISKGTPIEQKAAWFREAMRRMDDLLDLDTRIAVREACACCLGGKRLETVKRIAKQYSTFEERLAAANEAKLVFGHSVTLQDDGTIRVSFAPEGLPNYRCSCLGKVEGALPITYCYCCGGHVKHHLQIALGRKLVGTARSTALSTAGKKPCTFVFAVQEQG